MEGKEPRADKELLVYIGETMRALTSEAWQWLTDRGGSYINSAGQQVSRQD